LEKGDRTMRRRNSALALLGAITLLWVAAMAAPASGEVISGDCTGDATFSDGTRVDEMTPLSTTVVIPDGDTVTYNGSINKDKPSDPVRFDGGIDVRLPFGGFTVVTWGGDTEEVSITNGTYTYEVPSFVPRGTGDLEVTATHTQLGQTCVVAVTMSVEGDPGPAAIIGLTGTTLFAIGVLGAGFKKAVA
jgi:hypothetical protein